MVRGKSGTLKAKDSLSLVCFLFLTELGFYGEDVSSFLNNIKSKMNFNIPSNFFSYSNQANHKSLPSSFLFIILLYFSVATKLRLSGTSVGIFDVIFVLFAIVSFWSGRFELEFNVPFFVYWGSFFLFLAFSYWLNAYEEITYTLRKVITTNRIRARYDISAYFYCFIISFLMLNFNLKKRELKIFFSLLILTSAVLCFSVSVGSWSFFYPDSTHPYKRFSFLAQNPNQFALLMVPVPFFVLFFMDSCKKREFFYWSGIFVLSLYLMIRIRSYALILSSAVPLYAYPIFKIKSYQNMTRKLISGFFIIIFITSSYVIFKYCFPRYFIYCISELLLRLRLWVHVIKHIWQKGFLLGAGPGSLVPFEIRSEFLDFGFVSHLECHNTFLELINQTGIIPFCVVCYLLMKLGQRAFRDKQFILFFGLFSLVIFLFFHSFLRMPLMYIYFIILYKLLFHYKIEE